MRDVLKSAGFSVLAIALAAFAGCDRKSALAEAPEKFESMAKWVYCGPADNPATNAYLRYSLDIGKKVAKAYLRLNMEKGGNVYINGEKVSPVLWPPSREFFGHIKAF